MYNKTLLRRFYLAKKTYANERILLNGRVFVYELKSGQYGVVDFNYFLQKN